MSGASEPPVVLVDPAMTGRGFKDACRRRGLPTIALYTLDDSLLTTYDRDYGDGDRHVVRAADSAAARAQLPAVIRAVVPTSEPSIVVADELSEQLDLPGNPAATAPARRSKAAMRERALHHGVRVPAFAVTARPDVFAAARRIGFPAIAKPHTGAGSHGVVLIPDAAAQPELIGHDLFGHRAGEWLVERYVRGRELAVNTFSHRGRHRILDIWEYRQPTSADYDQPYWDVVQVRPEDPDWAVAAAFVERVLDVFGVDLGPGHTEIKIDEEGPCLIELASRLPGAHMVDHWQAHSSIRPYDDTLAAYLGEDPGLLDRDLAFDAVLGICCLRNDERPGVIEDLIGLDEARRTPGVDAVICDLAPGDHVPLTRDLGSLVGFVLVHGDDERAVAELLRTVRDKVRLELK
ncbi:biotin carboxylase [Actinoplanes lutulentus]|uniref:Biotin carboxylase n=1 Tax=Actinoplanes lutulentus TaxID=1287878 RepID=A0A327ZLH4_9ACTN|nr:ATP-grasp domain-containing protein [Actinoplanes lutulentus]MBB2942686.1 biotin carboxylase [Actinoplanes lutulentus]RAK38267.1 biotin carboxylase [Actinoplanes lutulentus]